MTTATDRERPGLAQHVDEDQSEVSSAHRGSFSRCAVQLLTLLFFFFFYIYHSSSRFNRVSLRNDPQPTEPGRPGDGGNFEQVELVMKSSIRIVGLVLRSTCPGNPP